MNTRSLGTLLTHTLQPQLILHAALTFLHLAALYLKQSVVSCW